MHRSKLLWLAALAACAPPDDPTVITSRATGPQADDQTVTLITGDRVTVIGGAPVVTPSPSRAGVKFSILRAGGRVQVIPSDAVALLAAGRLDPALFDVTGLLAAGYGDGKRADLPLIITGVDAGFAPAPAGAIVDHALPALHMLAVRQPKGATAGFAAAGSSKIWLDRMLKPTLDRSVPQIGGDVAHARGLTGAGITVAVLDTGVDPTHPDLADRVALAEDFTGDGQGPGDVVGHGTHVASIIAGTGAASAGRYAGVAPGARLISGRVCQLEGCAESAMLAGMAWAAVDQHARIINISIGGTDTPELDPLEQAVNTLSAETGALFVIAAGNDGLARAIESPGSADAALSVGAVGRDDSLAFFSSQGPRLGDSAVKPELTAPGASIVAARAANAVVGFPIDERYLRLSGTSMATPHVAGAAALVAQQHPAWTGAQLKAQLVATASPNPELTVFQQGAGRVDVDRATRQDVSAEPAVLSLGVAAFPHDDDPAIVQTVRYHNGGAAAITLALAARLSGPAGPAPIALSVATVTVPAGGTSAPVTVTVNTDGPLADGLYSGAIVATAGDVRIETPVGVEREPEQHDVTFEVIAHGASGFGFLQVFDTATQLSDFLEIDGHLTKRLPPGRYAMQISIFDPDESVIMFPRFEPDHDQTVTFDTADTHLSAIDVGDPGVGVAMTSYHYTDHVTGVIAEALSFGGPIAVGQLGGPLPPDEFTGWLAEVQNDDTFGPAKTIYNVAHREFGRVPIGFAARIPRGQLAKVEAHHIGHGEAQTKGSLAALDDGARGIVLTDFFWLNQYTGTFDRTEYFFGEGFVWASQFTDTRVDGVPFPVQIRRLIGEARYRPGEHHRETWNAAPAGPAFARDEVLHGPVTRSSSTASRTGDELLLEPSMTADANPVTRVELAVFASRRVALFRDGEEIIGGGTLFPVPPGEATYRFEAEVSQPAELFPLSPHVSAAWTFRSAHVPDGESRALPLLSMRFFPAVDEAGATRARVLVMPIRFERAPDAGTAVVLHATLEVSFDDGAHWRRVPVAAFGDRGVAVIVHPRDAAFVSLRATASEIDGNRVEQQITRAYAFKR